MQGNCNKLNLSFREKSISSQKDHRQSIRSFYQKKIVRLSSTVKKQKQNRIVDLMNKLSFWKKADFIAVYQALKDEPCLSSFYSLWKNKICFPIVQNEFLEFYKSQGQWRKNRFEVFEPIAKKQNKVPLDKISVFLIPGRVFDRNGGRLGRGQGYYDKTLANISKKHFISHEKEKGYFTTDLKADKQKKALFIGVAFVEQVHNESLPLFPHDISLDILITDQFTLMPLNQRST